MTDSSTPLAERSSKTYYFQHKDMDYYFSWVLGRRFYDAADPDECYTAAGRITDGEPASWQAGWLDLAREVEAEAARALEAGDQVSARKAYLRACTYYRAPLFIMGPQDERFWHNQERMQACFRQAAALSSPPLEVIRVPFKGHWLDGYFWKAAPDDTPRPTLIVIGGLETFAEDCILMVGPEAVQRGFNLITADLPGQGVNPNQGLPFGARMGEPVGAVVDYALTRPDVDPGRLALFGFSWGGHIVFKGVERETRLQALVANPAMPDVFRAAWAQQAGHDRSDPVSKVAFSQIAWRFGVKINFDPREIARRFGLAYDYLFHGRVDVRQIEIPVLCIAGEDEAKITLDIAQETIQKLPNPLSRLVIFTREQGGAAHCQVDNLPLSNGLMFDWLEEVLKRQ